jgi:hypothetical protein
MDGLPTSILFYTDILKEIVLYLKYGEIGQLIQCHNKTLNHNLFLVTSVFDFFVYDNTTSYNLPRFVNHYSALKSIRGKFLLLWTKQSLSQKYLNTVACWIGKSLPHTLLTLNLESSFLLDAFTLINHKQVDLPNLTNLRLIDPSDKSKYRLDRVDAVHHNGKSKKLPLQILTQLFSAALRILDIDGFPTQVLNLLASHQNLTSLSFSACHNDDFVKLSPLPTSLTSIYLNGLNLKALKETLGSNNLMPRSDLSHLRIGTLHMGNGDFSANDVLTEIFCSCTRLEYLRVNNSTFDNRFVRNLPPGLKELCLIEFSGDAFSFDEFAACLEPLMSLTRFSVENYFLRRPFHQEKKSLSLPSKLTNVDAFFGMAFIRRGLSLSPQITEFKMQLPDLVLLDQLIPSINTLLTKLDLSKVKNLDNVILPNSLKYLAINRSDVASYCLKFDDFMQCIKRSNLVELEELYFSVKSIKQEENHLFNNLSSSLYCVRIDTLIPMYPDVLLSFSHLRALQSLELNELQGPIMLHHTNRLPHRLIYLILTIAYSQMMLQEHMESIAYFEKTYFFSCQKSV